MVTEAAANKVSSHEKEEDFIWTQVVSRNLISDNRSKQDQVQMTKFRKPKISA